MMTFAKALAISPLAKAMAYMLMPRRFRKRCCHTERRVQRHIQLWRYYSSSHTLQYWQLYMAHYTLLGHVRVLHGYY